MNAVIIIPARYQSSRFPGKPLVKLRGQTMLERVYRIANAVGAEGGAHIATDDERIRAAGEAMGASVIMTSPDCRNGTERVAEALTKIAGQSDIIVNLQGDAPLTPPGFIKAVISALVSDPDCDMATPAVRCTQETLDSFKADRKAGRVGGTTVVTDREGRALYFSKEVIPYTPDAYTARHIPVLHHVGLYGYRRSLLNAYASWPPGELEQLEGLEQLRVLENGSRIKIVEVDAAGLPFWEVNNPEDVARVENIIDIIDARQARG